MDTSLALQICLSLSHLSLNVLGIVTPVKETSPSWSYLNQDSWPSTCKRPYQSPINIITNQAIPGYFENLHFDLNYCRKQNATLTNNGHTILIRLTIRPQIFGIGLQSEYILEQFHFHWPSEHTVNNHRFALEGHFVQYAKKYGNLENAINFDDGVVALAVFYDISGQRNPVFDNIIRGVPSVASSRNLVVNLQDGVSLYDFFPENTDNFYRYKGSITSPLCEEVVTWVVFATASYISQLQLQNLKQIWGNDNHLLQSNYRHLQPLNGRTVFYK